MARVNIEDAAFGSASLVRLGTALVRNEFDRYDLAPAAALGLLARLWHESQYERVTVATEAQIEKWTGFRQIVTLLVDAGYLTPVVGGQDSLSENKPTIKFHIHGNKEQIDNLEKKKIAGKRGGEMKAQKRQSSLADAKHVLADATENVADATEFLPSAKQNVAKPGQLQLQLQDRSKEEIPNTKKKRSREPTASAVGEPPSTAVAVVPPKARAGTYEPAHGAAVWEAYRESMLVHQHVDPIRNEETNTFCKKLVTRCGLPNALQIAAYYPSRQKAWYVDTGWNLKYCLQDYAALWNELQKGLKMTPDVVKKIVAKESSVQYDKMCEIGIVAADPFALNEAEEKRLLTR